MKFTASVLALIVGAGIAFGQESASSLISAPVLLAQAGAARPNAEEKAAPGDDSITIPAKSASRSGAAAKVESAPVTLWKLIQDGGWAMVPLAFLSVMTVMLVL